MWSIHILLCGWGHQYCDMKNTTRVMTYHFIIILFLILGKSWKLVRKTSLYFVLMTSLFSIPPHLSHFLYFESCIIPTCFSFYLTVCLSVYLLSSDTSSFLLTYPVSDFLVVSVVCIFYLCGTFTYFNHKNNTFNQPSNQQNDE